MSSRRTKIVLAAAVAAAGVAGALGCHLARGLTSVSPRTGQPSAALAQGASGIAEVQGHTRSAEAAVQQAVPHADPVGQAHLVTASSEHSAVLADSSKLQRVLDGLRDELEAANGRTAAAQDLVREREKELAHQQALQRELEGQWYVTGGRWIERMFWTLAIGYLVMSIASGLLGLGNPIGWIGRVGSLVKGAAHALVPAGAK